MRFLRALRACSSKVDAMSNNNATEKKLGDSVVKAQYIAQYEEMKRQNYGNKKGSYHDDFLKMENKVWKHLKKSTNIIDNYERMDIWVDDGDDFKMDYSGSGKKSSETKIDQNKVTDIMNLGMGFSKQQIENAIVATNNGYEDNVIDYILYNPTAHETNQNNSGISNLDDDNKLDKNKWKRQIYMEKKKQAKERSEKIFALGPSLRLTKTASGSVIHKIT
eukprot:528956_1